jgi:hypothetical protein
MTLGMEFHDARLLDLVCNADGSGHALFHASIYRSEGVVFVDAQGSGWQNFRLAFRGMWIDGIIAESGEHVSDGALWVDGKVQENVILLPANHHGTIQLDLVISPLFETLKIHANEISSMLEGPWELETIWSPDEMHELSKSRP